MLTRANVCYNLHKSPHLFGVVYGEQSIIYHFSSELYKTKFQERMEENRASINESLSKRFGFTVKSDILSDMRLYSTIEKRGFLISVDGEFAECQDNITLDGLKMTLRNSPEA